MHAPVLFVMVGLPASGKTHRAMELEREWGALRLTPDEWMIPLFGRSDADGRRDILEGRLIWLAQRALLRRVNVVLDFGVWSRDERTALRAMAHSASARAELVYMEVGEQEQLRRMHERQTSGPGSTFHLSEQELQEFREIFEAPDVSELDSTTLDLPPAGHGSWDEWSSTRWPTSNLG